MGVRRTLVDTISVIDKLFTRRNQFSISQGNNQMGDTAHTQSGRRIELHVREHAHVAHDRQQAVITRLHRLANDDIIDEFTVDSWGKHIATTPENYPPETVNTALEKATEYETWARQNGASLHPGFQHREHSSIITDSTREVIVLPIMCLADYEGDRLQTVIPCSDDGGHHSINSYLDTLSTETTESDIDEHHHGD